MTRKRIVVALLIAFALAGFIALASRTSPGTEYRTFSSPDGRFKVVVYRSRSWLGTMPGQAGDSGGTVCLYDAAAGKLLAQTRVEMVQLVDEVHWSTTNVEIRLI